MWKKLEHDPPYFIKFVPIPAYDIFITDYLQIWSFSFTKETFVNCLQDSNFGLEINENELLQKGVEMLSNPNCLKKLLINDTGTKLNVDMTISYGFPLKLKLSLDKCPKEMFFQNVTQQLLKTISDLRLSQIELCNLLRKKDKEIDRYKDEGGKVSIRDRTDTFCDEIHKSIHHTYEENFGECSIPVDLLHKKVELRVEPKIKEEIEEAKPAIKCEANTPTLEAPNTSTTSTAINPVKKEDIKQEPFNNISPRKRQRKLNY